jgi:hypothetical protein
VNDTYEDLIFPVAVQAFNGAVNQKDTLNIDFDNIKPIQQKTLSVAVDFRTLDQLKETLSRETGTNIRNLNLDRLNSIKEYCSFAWLLAVPNPNLGLAMTNSELQIALQLRLGHVTPLTRIECPGQKAHEIERSGLEILKCRCKFQHKRHNHLCEVFTNICRSAGFSTLREKLGLLRDGSRKRPGDVSVDTFDRGGKTAFDFRVTSNKQTLFTERPCKLGAAALHGDEVKMRNWNAVK